jgi:hypothetical protein
MEQTYKYYIYHIPSRRKIGATTELDVRMRAHGVTNDYEILETMDGDWDFGWIVGNREIELQKEYGYKVDDVHYQISRQNRRQGGIIGGSVRSDKKTVACTINASKGGIVSGPIVGKKHKESGQWLTVQKLGGSKTGSLIRNCPNCDRPLKGPGAYNSHTKKCLN